MSAQNTNHMTAEIYRLKDNIKELQLEDARNEARWKAENQELRAEIDQLIMSNAVADAEIEQRGRTADYWKANGVAANAEIERLKTHLASASCPHGCLSGDAGKYLSDGSFLKCFWCTARKSYIKEEGE